MKISKIHVDKHDDKLFGIVTLVTRSNSERLQITTDEYYCIGDRKISQNGVYLI